MKQEEARVSEGELEDRAMRGPEGGSAKQYTLCNILVLVMILEGRKVCRKK